MRFTLVHSAIMAMGSVALIVGIEKWSNLFQGYIDTLYPNLSSYIIIGLIAGMVIVGIYSRYNGENVEKKEIARKIHEELKDGIDSLDGTLDRTTMQYQIDGKNVVYKHIYMNHKVFDGLVNSGDFNHIDRQLQQPLQDIYGKINIHDEYVKKITELENDSPKEEEYARILNDYEKELLRDIPPMMEKLKK